MSELELEVVRAMGKERGPMTLLAICDAFPTRDRDDLLRALRLLEARGFVDPLGFNGRFALTVTGRSLPTSRDKGTGPSR